jgi:hypothetical protein
VGQLSGLLGALNRLIVAPQIAVEQFAKFTTLKEQQHRFKAGKH